MTVRVADPDRTTDIDTHDREGNTQRVNDCPRRFRQIAMITGSCLRVLGIFHRRELVFVCLVLFSTASFGQSKTKVTVDGALLRTAAAYREAIAEYRRNDDKSFDSVRQIDRASLRTIVALLLEARRTPYQADAPAAASRGGFSPANMSKVGNLVPFMWDRPTLLAAGMLHIDTALAEHKAGQADSFRFHVRLGAAILSIAGEPVPGSGEGDRLSRRLALAVGLMLLGEHDFAAARDYLAQATKRFPDDARLLLAFGTLMEVFAGFPGVAGSTAAPNAVAITRAQRNANIREANRLFERALAVDHGLGEARVRIAHLRLMERDDVHAAPLLEQVLASKPPSHLEYLARLMLGDVRERAHDVERALDLYQGALALRPDAQTASIALSHALEEAGHHDAAMAVIDRWLSKPPSSDTSDPWLGYRLGATMDVEAIFATLRAEVRR